MVAKKKFDLYDSHNYMDLSESSSDDGGNDEGQETMPDVRMSSARQPGLILNLEQIIGSVVNLINRSLSLDEFQVDFSAQSIVAHIVEVDESADASADVSRTLKSSPLPAVSIGQSRRVHTMRLRPRTLADTTRSLKLQKRRESRQRGRR